MEGDRHPQGKQDVVVAAWHDPGRGLVARHFGRRGNASRLRRLPLIVYRIRPAVFVPSEIRTGGRRRRARGLQFQQ
jgi:hypothetical protein